LNVYDPFAPQWVDTSLKDHSKIKRKLGQGVELDCASDAIPLAKVRWYKDDKELTETKFRNMTVNDSKLVIMFLYPGDEGVYKCQVENRLDRIERSFTVVITGECDFNIGISTFRCGCLGRIYIL